MPHCHTDLYPRAPSNLFKIDICQCECRLFFFCCIFSALHPKYSCTASDHRRYGEEMGAFSPPRRVYHASCFLIFHLDLEAVKLKDLCIFSSKTRLSRIFFPRRDSEAVKLKYLCTESNHRCYGKEKNACPMIDFKFFSFAFLNGELINLPIP